MSLRDKVDKYYATKVLQLWEEIEGLYKPQQQKEILACTMANSMMYARVYSEGLGKEDEFWSAFMRQDLREMEEVYQRVNPLSDDSRVKRQRRPRYIEGIMVNPARVKSSEEMYDLYDKDLQTLVDALRDYDPEQDFDEDESDSE